MDYEINKNTLAIIPDNNNSKILEENKEYYCESETFAVIEHSCEYFGSSYTGRHNGTKKLIGVTHKSPIIIEESSKLIFFPTTSPLRKDCVWISLNNIKSYYADNDLTSIIEFKSGEKLKLNLSIGSLTNQILRATRLKMVLDERIYKN